MTENNEQQKINIDAIENESCKECKSELWDQALIVKKVSAIISPTGKEELTTIPVIVCKKCDTLYHGYDKN